MAPWTPEQLVRVVTVNLVGSALIFAAWYEASGTTTVSGELAWFNLGILALVLAGGANGLWLVRGRQSIGLARTMMFGEPVNEKHATYPHTTSSSIFVASPGAAHYHQQDCALSMGRTVVTASRDEHLEAGLVACEVCEP
jgi:hypothetical protein